MMSRVLALLLLMLMGGTAAGCTNTPESGNPRFGVSPGANILWLPEAEMHRELDLYSNAGFGWIRLDIDWNSIEPSPGEFNWHATDLVVKAARDRNMRVLAMPAYSPPWAATVPGDPHSEPADMTSFAQFVGRAVARYAPLGVHDWEIWNEPNSSLFWKPRPNVAQYAEMLKLTSAAIREQDDQATIVAGALAPASDAANGSQIAPVTFVEQLFAEGAAPSFDVLSVHPYTYPQLPTDPDSSWQSGFDLTEIHRTMTDLGDPKDIWITEFGAPTGTDPRAVSETRQAQILVSGVSDAPPSVQKVFLYGGRDRGWDESDREQNFGFVRSDFSAKPSLTALQEALIMPSPSG